MGTYIGQLGRLVRLHRVRTQGVDHWDGTTFQRTLEGRMRAQVKSKRNRAWNIDMSMATPADLANIQAFQDGEWGNGPFVWVPPGAPTTNMLMPDVSTTGPSSRVDSWAAGAGPMRLPDGSWTGRSIMNGTPLFSLNFGPPTTPVIPGKPVTASAYVVGAGARVGVAFFDAGGSKISTALSPTDGVAGVAKRLSVATMAPVNAISCQVFFQFGTQAARPALTWTDKLFDWGIGAGCSKAIVYGFSTELNKQLSIPSTASLSSLNFTVQEVG